MCERTEPLIVPGVLVHGYANDAEQKTADTIVSFMALLKLDVFVPEMVCEEVKADHLSTALEQSAQTVRTVPRFQESRARENKRERLNTQGMGDHRRFGITAFHDGLKGGCVR